MAALVDPVACSQLAIAEALTNIVFAPLTYGLEGVSLSANWMWPCRNEGEDARLYDAVEAASDLAISLVINIPTGKDSLSMTQKYPNGEKVLSPGTVIISAIGEVSDVKKILSPVLVANPAYPVYHIDFSFSPLALGGSAFAQALGQLGDETPRIEEPEYFREAFTAVQELIQRGVLTAGHDISGGGLITALLEGCRSTSRPSTRTISSSSSLLKTPACSCRPRIPKSSKRYCVMPASASLASPRLRPTVARSR